MSKPFYRLCPLASRQSLCVVLFLFLSLFFSHARDLSPCLVLGLCEIPVPFSYPSLYLVLSPCPWCGPSPSPVPSLWACLSPDPGSCPCLCLLFGLFRVPCLASQHLAVGPCRPSCSLDLSVDLDLSALGSRCSPWCPSSPGQQPESTLNDHFHNNIPNSSISTQKS